MSDSVDIRPGQVWQAGEHEQIRVDEVDLAGNTVSGSLTDTRLNTHAVWAGSPNDFENFELVGEDASGSSPTS